SLQSNVGKKPLLQVPPGGNLIVDEIHRAVGIFDGIVVHPKNLMHDTVLVREVMVELVHRRPRRQDDFFRPSEMDTLFMKEVGRSENHFEPGASPRMGFTIHQRFLTLMVTSVRSLRSSGEIRSEPFLISPSNEGSLSDFCIATLQGAMLLSKIKK